MGALVGIFLALGVVLACKETAQAVGEWQFWRRYGGTPILQRDTWKGLALGYGIILAFIALVWWAGVQ